MAKLARCGHTDEGFACHDCDPDIIIENHGSIAIIRGMTDAGYAWVEEHISSEGYQPFGLGARLAEPRYVQDIIDGAQDDGLLVQT